MRLSDHRCNPGDRQGTAEEEAAHCQAHLERLRDERGFTGKITIVKDHVADWRQRIQEMFAPLKHPPHHVHFLEMNGDSYRLPHHSDDRDAQKRIRRPKCRSKTKTLQRKTPDRNLAARISAAQLLRQASRNPGLRV